MTSRPELVQAPTLQQILSAFAFVRKGREIVAKGELTPEDAVELREIMDWAERVFELRDWLKNPPRKDFPPDLRVIKGALES